MGDIFEDDYNLNQLRRVKVKDHGFDLYITPRFLSHYVSQPDERMTSTIISKIANEVKTFIDIGAHYRFFTILVGLPTLYCQIFSFEPIAQKLRHIKKMWDSINFGMSRYCNLPYRTRKGGLGFKYPRPLFLRTDRFMEP